MENILLKYGYKESETEAKIEKIFFQLFESKNETEERICFYKDDLAYIVDTGHNDIRSEGMSYGMAIAAILNKKNLFDKLWNFSKRYMLNKVGNHTGYFAWQVSAIDFSMMDKGAAPDGEEYFAFALLLAAEKFKEESYKTEALDLLNRMLYKKTSGNVRSLFDLENFIVRFSPVAGNDFTDPSYHTIAFYRIFKEVSNDETWDKIIKASEKFLENTMHKTTGLTPDYAEYDGTPKKTIFNPKSDLFSGDSWRVIFNLALDYSLNKNSEFHFQEQRMIRKILHFFENKKNYKADYFTDGKIPEGSREKTVGLIAMNAAGVIALNHETQEGQFFIEDFWNVKIPTGKWRYYDSLLYFLSLLALSGKFLDLKS